MKQYETWKLVVTFFGEDVLTTSTNGTYEGVNELSPTLRSDWFE